MTIDSIAVNSQRLCYEEVICAKTLGYVSKIEPGVHDKFRDKYWEVQSHFPIGNRQVITGNALSAL